VVRPRWPRSRPQARPSHSSRRSRHLRRKIEMNFPCWAKLLRRAALAASLLPYLSAVAQQPTPPPAETATVYKNGHIYTNDPAQPWAEVMVVQDGKIMAIGAKSLISAYILERHASTIVDLHGAFVMPGFNDAHTHFGAAAADMLSVRLYGAASIEEL